MLEKIFSSAKGEVLQQLQNKFQLDASTAEKTATTAQQTVQAGLMKEVTSGNVSGLMNMFNSGNVAGNPVVNNLSKQVVDALTAKVGLNSQTAAAISTFIIPFILNKISGNKPASGFDIGSLTKMFTGGSGNVADALKGDIGKKLGGFFK